MNLSILSYHRGFFRLWILLSILWIFGTFFLFLQHGIETQNMLGTPPPDELGNPTSWMWISMEHNWPLFLVGPIGLLLLAVVILVAAALLRWVWHGFRVSN